MNHASLDDLISRKAEEFADQVRRAAEMADKEEEIRIEVEKQLAFLQKEASVKLQGKHEFTVASGRIDSVYNAVIIEYKNPANAASRIGPEANSPGAKKVVEQIKQRFYDMPRDQMKTLFGVGCDGKHFIFVRFYHDKWQVQDPVEVNKHSAERFLWALFNLGTRGKRFEPDYLAGDFGSGQASIAAAGIKVLYDAISTTSNPKAQTFFNQWKILFGEVCGYDVDNPSDKIKKLADFYGVEGKGVKPAEMLFAVHTYYALFMKLLAGEIITHSYTKLGGRLVEKLVNSPTAAKLRENLNELESGGIFRHLNITNFLEGDLFAWYLPAWSEAIESVIRAMARKLDEYNPGTLAEEPAESRDLLKKLYQQLFPKSVRHDLGEYYTPDWLAEHVLNELGYIGDPDKRLLDPACGSGTFLVMAIARIRAWYEKNREICRYDEGELCKKILANVVGFDLNPLAVMAARTNYLIAIRDLVSHVDKVEIPVYLCDSILTPSAYGGLFAGSTTAAKELKTSAARFLVPTEIATNASDVAKYAEQLEFCVRNSFAPDEFIHRCQNEGLPITATSLHVQLYTELVALDKANKNGVWARIIKNAFAPLFIGQVDYVAGNPPWVFWNNLPSEYRDAVKKILTDQYRLAAPSASSMKRLGSAGKDISALFVYACLHEYCSAAGTLGFVITQTVFQSTASDEFRRFVLPGQVPFRIKAVDDWVGVSPFTGAANKTATFVAEKGKETDYPVQYRVWSTHRDFDRDTTSIDDAFNSLASEIRWARPSDPDRPESLWVIGTDGEDQSRISLESAHKYEIRRGVETGLESAYRVRVLRTLGKNDCLVQNITDRARKPLPSVTGQIEINRVFPYLTGSSIGLFRCWSTGCYIVPHTAETGMTPLSEATMKRQWSNTYSFLRQFESDLQQRNIHKRWGKRNPFYSLYNIGPYTFSPWKVIWKRTTKHFEAAVASVLPVTNGQAALAIPNGKVMMIPFDDAAPAHFVCAVINSSPARQLINSGISSEAHAEILSLISVPEYSDSNAIHRRLSALSIDAHTAALEENAGLLEQVLNDIDEQVGLLWGLAPTRVEEAQRHLGQNRLKLRRAAASIGVDSDEE